MPTTAAAEAACLARRAARTCRPLRRARRREPGTQGRTSGRAQALHGRPYLLVREVDVRHDEVRVVEQLDECVAVDLLLLDDGLRDLLDLVLVVLDQMVSLDVRLAEQLRDELPLVRILQDAGDRVLRHRPAA